jgi:hypothetical protein
LFVFKFFVFVLVLHVCFLKGFSLVCWAFFKGEILLRVASFKGEVVFLESFKYFLKGGRGCFGIFFKISQA